MAETFTPLSSPTISGTGAAPLPEPEIFTIPEKYYGAALKASTVPVTTPAPESGEGKASRLPLVIGVVALVLLLLVGGVGFWQREAILAALRPIPPVVVEPTPEPPVIPVVIAPTVPVDLAATSTGSASVSVSWTDTSANESGFRVERGESVGAFLPLTNLPPNATSFLDTTVQPDHGYRYRIIAVNAGGDSAPSLEAPVQTRPLPPPAPEAPKLPPAGLDTDSDGLTDLEEVLLKSDPRNPDTDDDGFLDGNEAFHLYNPSARAPGRLVETGQVKPYSSLEGWSVLIPNDWTVTVNGATTTISTGHGEMLQVLVLPGLEGISLLDWYHKAHPEVSDAQILKYRSKKGYEGIIGGDQLTTYLPWGTSVFTLRYDFGAQPFKNFSTVTALILNSLDLPGIALGQTPASAPLPFEPSSSTQGVIVQPEAVNATPVESTPSSP